MIIRSSLLAFMAAFAAILSMMAIPSGMMPAWGEDGFAIKLCSPYASDSVKIAKDDPQFETLKRIDSAKKIAMGEAPVTDDDDSQIEHCAFSIAGSGAFLLSAAPNIIPLGGKQMAAALPSLNIVIAQRLHLPPSTGPPAHS